MAITLTLCILLAAVLLFATEWLPMDVVAMLILLALAITGLVSVPEALSGFSNPAVITVAAMFVISAGITHTGALGKAGEHLIRLAGGSEMRLTVIIMASVAVFSAFINNIGATAVLMPVIVDICRRMHVSPSKMLIPLAYGSLLGGVCTLVGTPPNILMNALLYEYTGERFGLFSFSPLGIVLVIVGISYMALVGRRMLPTRKSEKLTEAYQVKEYITQVKILKDSPVAGQTIAGSALERDFQLRVRAILRGREKFPQPRRNRKLRVDDILFLEGNPHGILKVMAAKGLQLIPERAEQSPRRGKELLVVEASLTPNSDMVGKTLRQVRFRETHGLNVLALWRQGAPVVKKVDHVVLRFGDVLLLQGDDAGIKHLGRQHGFLLLGGVEPVPYRPRQAPMALMVLAGVILLTSTEVLPIALAAPLGALGMVLSRCLTAQEAYESIDWRIILLIAGTLPLGLALENSGAASLLAERLLHMLGNWGPYVVMAAFFLLTSVLTEIMSHAATAVLIAPIALHAAMTLQVSPRPFFMAVAVAASSCFMTPISHQSNALVMGPGGYRFSDFMRTGVLLNLLVWVCACLLIPWLFPF
ncbi:membrane protein, TrkA-C domain pair-containing [Syntrophotalea carbinolica DSM 2380]|uniref:Membrane protein, TrkA-C domain pair-containing n=1 Tax=Syntrophotalea carbinolica (strain DSM 2380 / NBRC 103641 / GraBd1) TaxID=338963 RepID=Q3A6Z2_SYNC1|nr:SLC13 family permease [Syntrophotalea carbinolica]ABA87865.1 membrane protein, TrkA-C domain pair-containing [Syntrophotalea carbinolica DSM 2380]